MIGEEDKQAYRYLIGRTGRQVDKSEPRVKIYFFPVYYKI